ncbi:MAG: AraC family transcriptional regulator [Monoglobales bacterium]
MYLRKTNYGLSGFGIEIDYAAYAILDNTWRNKNVCDPFSRLYFIKDGSGTLVCEGRTIETKPGHIYLIPADCIFDYSTDEKIEKIFFHIYINTLERYDLLSNVKSICEIEFEANEFDELLNCIETDDYFKLFKLKLIIYKTLHRMLEKYNFNSVPIKQYSDGVKKAMEYIHRNTKISLSTEIVSEKLFISKSKLRKDFKNETGISIGKYIDDMVFFKAKRLLNKGYLSINEISQKLGFCDQFYFSRRFKERFGVPPSDYRKRIFLEKSKGE